MYPTKTKILTKKIKHKKETIELMKKISLTINSKNKKQKINSMLKELEKIYNTKTNIKISKKNKHDCYNPKTNTIYLKDPPSIITALHEFSHHLYGSSEIQACRWSTQLFIKTFPNLYKKLKWKGHLLIKK